MYANTRRQGARGWRPAILVQPVVRLENFCYVVLNGGSPLRLALMNDQRSREFSCTDHEPTGPRRAREARVRGSREDEYPNRKSRSTEAGLRSEKGLALSPQSFGQMRNPIDIVKVESPDVGVSVTSDFEALAKAATGSKFERSRLAGAQRGDISLEQCWSDRSGFN